MAEETGPGSIALVGRAGLRIQVDLQIVVKLRHVGLLQHAGVACPAYQKTSMPSVT
jgi:hypothetical protein